MGRALDTLANFQATAINRSCRPRVAFAQEEVCQVALSGKRGWIFRSKLGLERVDELTVERLGRNIVSLVREQIGKIVQTPKGVGTFWSSCPAHRLPGAACIWFGPRKVSPGLEDQRQVVETRQGVRMVRPQGPLSRFQRLQMESLSLGILSALVEQIGQIVHRRQSVDMVGAQALFDAQPGICERVLQPPCILLCLEAPAPRAPSIRRFAEPPPVVERATASRTQQRKSGCRKQFRESTEKEPIGATLTGRSALTDWKSF